MPTKIPRCPVCGDKIGAAPPYYRTEAHQGVYGAGTADGKPPTHGHMGDNLFCSMICGYTLAVRLVQCNPGILDTLPPEWRADLVPWDTWKAGKRFSGKRAWVVERGQEVKLEQKQCYDTTYLLAKVAERKQ